MSFLEPNTEISDEDTFSILIATDNHLGYNDSDHLDRENDSFNTFEEILTIGNTKNVDFVLLGGDLFHENKPKPATFHRTVDILQRHCLGSKPVEFEYLGDPAKDFRGSSTAQVNYENPNINIGLPIFTIHGNHDDPIGAKKTSAIDHLAAANLLNHFGQPENVTEFSIRPLLFRKGVTHLAIYGLGNLRDERLYRLMRDNKVTFLRPEVDGTTWFNIFVVHQNRQRRGPTNYFPEAYIPDFMDLVIWGHEHDCRVDPELCGGRAEDKPCYIIQPGSSVATSLCDGEATDKYICFLQVNKRNFKPTKIKLETVRPFIFSEVFTGDILKAKVKEPAKSVETYVQARVKALIEEAYQKLTGHEKQPLLPLIRIRIIYQNENEQFNAMRFAQQFSNDVANEDIILFKRAIGKREEGGEEMDIGALQEMIMQTENESLDDLGSHVEEIVEKHFANERTKGSAGQNLEILSEKGLSEAVRTCVEKGDKEVLSIIIDAQIKKMMDHLIRHNVTADTIEEELTACREARIAHADQEVAEVREALKNRTSKKNGTGEGNSTEDDSEGVVDDDDSPPSRGKGRGAARGGGARGGRGRGGGKARAPSESPARGSKAGPVRGGARGGRGRGKGGQVPPANQPKLPVSFRGGAAAASSSVIQFDSSGSD